jgi:hypothetical protein
VWTYGTTSSAFISFVEGMDMSIAKRKLKSGSFAFQATDRTPHFPSISKTFATRREARELLISI